MKRIIKEQVKAQTSKIMTKVEKIDELKKILMDKMEENNSIDRSDVQKNLYRALLEAYNSDKDLLSSYGERQRSGKKAESSKEPTHKESRTTSTSKRPSRSQQTDLEDPTHQEFITEIDDISPIRRGDFKRLRHEDIEDMLLLIVPRQMTSYNAYRDNTKAFIYQDDMDRNRLMRIDELYKFRDSTLNHVRTSLNDIAIGIQMEYLPKRK
ncbi:hypothetical protein Tco_0733218 [Tanacetum coccineum]